MRKVYLFFLILFIFSSYVNAETNYSNITHNNYPNHSSHGSSSNSVYIINRETRQDEIKFPDCNEHYVLQETIINHYSDGTKKTYTNSSLYNSDGSLIVSDCSEIKHIIYKNKHYFIITNQKGTQILNSQAKKITTRKYSSINEIAENRLLVRYDKRYGVIDLDENIIIPIKYQGLEENGHNILIAKLNGYYGIVDINNNTLIDCDCEKIKTLFDTIIIKRYNKYGLTDLNGKIILGIEYDKIDKLGEYITVKNNNKYKIYDYSGKLITEKQYKKFKLKRNHLFGFNDKNIWENI